MDTDDEKADEYRAIGRARPPQPPWADEASGVEPPEPGWGEPPMPVDDVPMPQRETTSRADKQRNQRR
jgi:hypothetical protein